MHCGAYQSRELAALDSLKDMDNWTSDTEDFSECLP